MNRSKTVKAIIPDAPTHIKCRDGVTYQIGGFTDEAIIQISHGMLSAMLDTARKQRKAKAGKGEA